jgi:hypothetical protein
MVTYKDYVAGWLDSSIHDFLSVFPRTSGKADYALITCLDSNCDPGSLLGNSPELASLAAPAQVLGTGLLLPTEMLLEAESRNRVFFGFDEIWFFPTKQVEPKPDSASLVGPARLSQTKLDKLGKWLSANTCTLALGDGDGLNFIVKARGLVKHLLGHSLGQLQSSAPVVASPPSSVAV